MADLNCLNPCAGEGQGRCNLTHFAGKFPQHVMANNWRVDQRYADFSYQLLRKKDFSEEQFNLDRTLRASVDLDEYIVQQGISLDAIDQAINKFRVHGTSENPRDYLTFFVLARPIFYYLIDDKKHKAEYLIG